MTNWSQVSGFDWDEGNARKSADKHGVTQAEAERVFLNQPLLLLPDASHSEAEARYHALGATDEDRLLHVTFTLRGGGQLIRVISARDMHPTESELMSKRDETIPEFRSETEERAFWEANYSTDYLDWSQAQRGSFPNLKPSTKTISLRLPEALLEQIKTEAHMRDMPYQSLIKAWLAEDVKRNRG